MVGGRKYGWAIAALVLLGLAFAQSLGGEFVWDDAWLIEHNPAMRSPRGFLPIVTRDLWGQASGEPSQLYHPLPMLSIWLQARLFGVHLLPLRLANIAIHALVVWLFFRLLLQLALPRTAAMMICLVVLVHPSVCEPVMWITGRHDTLAMVFVLAALLIAVGRDGATLARGLAAGALLAAAFLCKEPYVIGPALLALRLGCWQVQTRRLPRWREGASVALAALPLSAAWMLRRRLGISLGSAQLTASAGEHARNYASIVWHYGRQLLCFDNGPTLSAFVPLHTLAAIGVWLLVAVVTGVLAWTARSQRCGGAVALFGWLWFLVALAPHLISTPTIGMYGNRYAYCALFGLAACAAGLCLRLSAAVTHARLRAAARPAALVLALSCALHTATEAAHWRDNRTLFAADVLREPNNGYAAYHLGTAVQAADGCKAALPMFIRATELAPRYERPWHNASGCLINLGRAAAALPFAQRSVELAPHNPRSRYNLALAELASGDRAGALTQLERALRLDPAYSAASRTLAELRASEASRTARSD
jgi:4-amino-4-deoxy-L-arabinose transferase-like glycosyltransferase